MADVNRAPARSRPLLGAHESIAGGLHRAFDRILAVGGESLQIFTANQRQWRVRPPGAEDIRLFREKWQAAGGMPVAAHGSYLINLAAADPAAAHNSIDALADELGRCRQLGIAWVVLHPGSHLGAGIEAGLEAVARNLDQALEHRVGFGDEENSVSSAIVHRATHNIGCRIFYITLMLKWRAKGAEKCL